MNRLSKIPESASGIKNETNTFNSDPTYRGSIVPNEEQNNTKQLKVDYETHEKFMLISKKTTNLSGGTDVQNKQMIQF